jgi:hypothetical protein
LRLLDRTLDVELPRLNEQLANAGLPAAVVREVRLITDTDEPER